MNLKKTNHVEKLHVEMTQVEKRRVKIKTHALQAKTQHVKICETNI